MLFSLVFFSSSCFVCPEVNVSIVSVVVGVVVDANNVIDVVIDAVLGHIVIVIFHLLLFFLYLVLFCCFIF